LSATNVFWAVEIPEDSTEVELDEGTASLHVQNLCVYDSFTIPNSLMGVNRPVNQVKGIINSLDIDWSGILSTETANQPPNKMSGTFLETNAKIAVTATTPRTAVTALSNGHGFRFVSDPASTSVKNFALIGHEQNGVFF